MKGSIIAVLLGALGAMSACSQADTSLGSSQGTLAACAPNDCKGKPVPQVQCANSSPTVSCERAGRGACSPVPHCDSADAASPGAPGVDSGASPDTPPPACTDQDCAGQPQPGVICGNPGAAWVCVPNSAGLCRWSLQGCDQSATSPDAGTDAGRDSSNSTMCAPIPCPMATPWNQATCSCAGGAGSSGGKSDGGSSSPPLGGCNVEADCHGPLPGACVICPNGSKNGCPHWTCSSAGLCVTAACD